MKQTALITGASSGLGKEFALLLASMGYDLVLVARREDLLRSLAEQLTRDHGIRVHICVQDLAAADGAERVATFLRAQKLSADLLVNNAGFGSVGPFDQQPLETHASMLAVNVTALTMLTRFLLPDMLVRGSGRILNVASTAGFVPGPLMAVYYASKAYVLSFSLALSEETRGTGVTVTCVCPGATRTEFGAVAHMEHSRLFMGTSMDAATVARIGIRGCLRDKALVVTGMRNKFLAFGTRLVPRVLAARVARRAQEQA